MRKLCSKLLPVLLAFLIGVMILPRTASAKQVSTVFVVAGNVITPVIESSRQSTEEPPFTLFTTPLFDTVHPNTMPSEGDTSGIVRAWGVPGQKIQAAFCLHANQDLDDVSISVNDFVAGPYTIPSSNIDIRVVKVWLQAGLDRLMEDDPVLVPELLVYDDNFPLTGGWNFTCDCFPPGQVGNGYLINGDSALSLDSKGVFDSNEGTIDFWVKPNWSGTDNFAYREFVLMSDDKGSKFRIYSSTDGSFYAIYDDGPHWMACNPSDDFLFTEGLWTRITFTWDTITDTLSLYFDGTLVSTTTGIIEPMGTGVIHIGGEDLSVHADSIMDEMRFYDYSASPNNVEWNTYDTAKLTKHITFESQEDIADSGGDLHRMIYNPPDPPVIMNTEIPSKTTKQFWFKVCIPKNTEPGTYRTEFTVHSTSVGDVNIPVELQLLPFRLDESPLAHMVYLGGQINTPHLTYELLDIYLDDMLNHGLNGLSIGTHDISEQPQILNLIRSKGFKYLVQSSSTENISDRILNTQDHNYPPYFYGIDEANHSPKIERHILKSHEIHSAGGLVATTVLKQTSDKLDDPNSDVYDYSIPGEPNTTFRDIGITNEGLDWANYHATYLEYNDIDIGNDQNLLDYIEVLRSGGDKLEKFETYYWQPWVQKYKWDRNMAGFFLWGSDLDGTWPWHYVDIPDYFWRRDPYDDFDSQNTPFRDTNIVYPIKGGVLPTLQWEAMAEGITDVRYLATLENLIKHIETADPARANVIREWIDSQIESYMTPNQSESMSDALFDQTRRNIAMKILELILIGDFEPDGDVDWHDLSFFTTRWLRTGCEDSNGFCDGCDFDKSGTVNFKDFANLARYWLVGVK